MLAHMKLSVRFVWVLLIVVMGLLLVLSLIGWWLMAHFAGSGFYKVGRSRLRHQGACALAG